MPWTPSTLEHYRALWQAEPDGDAFSTATSLLQPVTVNGTAAMLKVARDEEEARAASLLAAFDGDGAAPVLRHDAHAVLMLRATGTRSLEQLAHEDDDEATRILAETALRLHDAARLADLASRELALTDMRTWFAALFERERSGGLYQRCAAIAHALLSVPGEALLLHGDIHHRNVLDFGEHGWLAIDPKPLRGHPTFDLANILCNPDPQLAESHFDRRVTVICDTTGTDYSELLAWTAAWAGLSAAWSEDDDPGWSAHVLTIGSLALDRLRRAASES